MKNTTLNMAKEKPITLGIRGRCNLNVELELMYDRMNEKKGRLEEHDSKLMIFEVGKTNREWSQSYK